MLGYYVSKYEESIEDIEEQLKSINSKRNSSSKVEIHLVRSNKSAISKDTFLAYNNCKIIVRNGADLNQDELRDICNLVALGNMRGSKAQDLATETFNYHRSLFSSGRSSEHLREFHDAREY
jgi:hypothetical protein